MDNTIMSEDTAVATPVLGFWLYLMTDCLLFASLFATFIVLRDSTFGGPSGRDLFRLPFVLQETLILLTSSFACGLALLAARDNRRKLLLVLLTVVFLLGAAFLGLEISEFQRFVLDGNGPTRSGFLSAFFTLVGTHGTHISFGLLWLAVLFIQIARQGLHGPLLKRLTMFSLFWHFLDLVWIFIFTIVYLFGAIS